MIFIDCSRHASIQNTANNKLLQQITIMDFGSLEENLFTTVCLFLKNSAFDEGQEFPSFNTTENLISKNHENLK